MAVSSSTILRGVKEYLLITLGIVIYTVGWAIFLTPNNLIGGGVSGISAIIQYATGLKMGYSYFVINTVLLIISVIIIGPAFGAKTVYAIILASVCLNVFQSIIPETIIQDFALSNGKLMCSIIGGSMAGLGIGMSISQGGSTGGDGYSRLDHHEIQEYISRTHYPHYGCVHHRFVAVVPVLRC